MFMNLGTSSESADGTRGSPRPGAGKLVAAGHGGDRSPRGPPVAVQWMEDRERRRMDMECRRCGACCIALSISSLHKPPGVRCAHLNEDNLCALWGKPERPEVCSAYRPEPLFCGDSHGQALEIMMALEGSDRGPEERKAAP